MTHRSDLALKAREARDLPSPFFSPSSRAFEKFFERKGRGVKEREREGMRDHALHAPHALNVIRIARFNEKDPTP